MFNTRLLQKQHGQKNLSNKVRFVNLKKSHCPLINTINQRIQVSARLIEIITNIAIK